MIGTVFGGDRAMVTNCRIVQDNNDDMVSLVGCSIMPPSAITVAASIGAITAIEMRSATATLL